MTSLNARRMLLIAVLAVWNIMLPDLSGAEDIRCDMQAESCTGETSDGITIEFDIQPKPVTTLADLTFIVKLSKNNAPVADAAVRLDLAMPGMYMGKNAPIMKKLSAGHYEGKGVLTRCASGRKTWKANIAINHDQKDDTAGFQFEVK